MAKLNYMKSLMLDDMFADAWFGAGVIKIHEGKDDEAVIALNKALKINNNNLEYLFALASAYSNLQQYDKAIEIFQNLVDTIKNDSHIWDNYAQVYAKQENFAKSISIISEALRLNPESALLRYRFAAYHLLNGEQQQGMTVLEEALAAYPEESECFFEVFETTDDDHEIMNLIKKYKRLA
jgi:tetratricopeptide (TPR) repeat protein